MVPGTENKIMIILKDTFNQSIISTHRTVAAAVRAQRAHARRVERKNGRGSYISYSISSTTGEDIREEVDCCRFALDNE